MEGVDMKKKEQRIVVAVDESEESMYALSWCLSNLVSHTPDCKLVLLYVKPPPPVYSSIDAPGYLFSNDLIATLEKYGTDLVRSVMERAEAVYRNFSIDVERVVGSGEAKDVICNAVKQLEADTLVMGSHGYGFLKRAFLGSVSDYCAKNVKCPVVIVKNHDK
ncbi:universal stress protein A-like protein [Tripterygium wilfordii]|uniref:Universal stress protein A-like protein n=1 Tax=Tripterygium wilfordii TaxID=458696 RepID=A0A7J7D5D3_TRIWF|nr:universal stress protein A-like protein isoform X2 [Tripterygium wilfordii]KAF5741532.1 universal stress protein A-like protein [Tripterygium wilfordii]